VDGPVYEAYADGEVGADVGGGGGEGDGGLVGGGFEVGA